MRQYGGIHFKDGDLEARVAGAEVGEQALDKAVTYFSGKAILKP